VEGRVLEVIEQAVPGAKVPIVAIDAVVASGPGGVPGAPHGRARSRGRTRLQVEGRGGARQQLAVWLSECGSEGCDAQDLKRAGRRQDKLGALRREASWGDQRREELARRGAGWARRVRLQLAAGGRWTVLDWRAGSGLRAGGRRVAE